MRRMCAIRPHEGKWLNFMILVAAPHRKSYDRNRQTNAAIFLVSDLLRGPLRNSEVALTFRRSTTQGAQKDAPAVLSAGTSRSSKRSKGSSFRRARDIGEAFL